MNILFLGDISLNNKIMDNVSKKIELPFDSLVDTQKYDFVFANFESPISLTDVPVRKKVTLRTTKEAGAELKKINENIVVSLANNHLLDYGLTGYNETVKALNAKGIDYFGVVEHKDYCISEKENIVIIGECFKETTPLYEYDKQNIIYNEDINRISESIKEYKQNGYKIILYLHWGTEFCRYPSKEQRNVAKKFIDNGADCIVGHHPHIVQSMEKYKGKYIFYSLGNFLFADVISNNSGKTFYNTLLRSNKRSIAIDLKIENNELYFSGIKYYKITNSGQVISSQFILNKLSVFIFMIGNRIPFVPWLNHKLIKFVNYYHIFVSKLKFKDLNIKDLVRKIFGKSCS